MREEDYILIERYLEGDLSISEKQAFEQQLSQDETLQKELELRRSMDVFVSSRTKDAAFLKTLQAENDKHFNKQGAVIKPMTRRNKIITLASMAAAAVIAFFLVTRVLLPDPNLYEEYNPHQNISLNLRGDGNLLGQIENAFNSKDYQKAYDLSQQYLGGDIVDVQIQEVLGRAALELDKLEEAEQVFKSISGGSSLYKNNGYWYLGLTYLKQEKNNLAKAEFQKIASNAGKIYRQAQEIIKEIE